MPEALFLEPCNFEDFPMGGGLSFARQMVQVFGSRLALVGISTDETPVGRWVKRAFGRHVCDFFSIGRWRKSACKPVVPARLRVYLDLQKHRRQILSLDTRAAFISSPEMLLASREWGWSNLCYLFAGLDSPLQMSRYRWAERLAGLFDECLLSALRPAHLLLAAADGSAREAFAARTGGRIPKENIIAFPTRVDTDIFHPRDQAAAREETGIPQEVPVFVGVGRLHRRKGWALLLEAFQLLSTRRADAHLYFVGDGEDRSALEHSCRESGLTERVHITGCLAPQRVAAYLNAANVFVLGSHAEGWPTALVEALATGTPIVSTSVGAAVELVQNGKNGYVVESRDAQLFCEVMVKALQLDRLDARTYSLDKVQPYALSRLAEDLGQLWAPLRA